ncbi:MAG: YeeE/YedE family protein [Pseudomonadota bacterium]
MEAPRDHVVQRLPLAAALLILVAVAWLAYDARGGWSGDGLRYAAGTFLGALAGVGLYHAAFGFTGAWRRLVRERRGGGLRAQMLLIGLAAAVTYPLIGFEAETGWNMHPVVLPMGLVSGFGALVFGAGMQLGGGCASGTLFTAGGGSSRMGVTLLAFVVGSVAATAHLNEFWFQVDEMTGIYNLPGTSVIRLFGPFGGLAALLALLLAVWVTSVAVERARHGDLETPRATVSLIGGPWSLVLGAVALAAVSIGCFLLFQRPWGVTSGFALWGAKALDAAGVPVRDWGYWSGWRAGQLDRSVFADRVSVMNFGILTGALAAAALAGRFRPVLALSHRDLATAVIGGLLMGYGARLAFGCNIGAYLGGLVSGSLHGVWWLVFGFAGSYVGVWLRSRIGVDPPLGLRPSPS